MSTLKISGKSKTFGIIGDPVAHSLSPLMHNSAFKYLNLDCAYLPFRVKKADLRLAVDGIRALNISGVNVTIPHKVSIVPLLDWIEPAAKEIGAVNTILNQNGTLRGYNTDGDGFLLALTQKGVDVKDKNVVILGAGGAARAISFVLAEKGANLAILNRTPAPAKEFANRISSNHHLRVKALALNDANLAVAVRNADILINATSVGMNNNERLVSDELLRPSLIVCDIVYTPAETGLLSKAAAAGAMTISGVEMLVRQAALSFKIWIGIEAPAATMRRAALNALR